VVAFPRVNAAHAGHPAREGHLATLRRAGVSVVAAEDPGCPASADGTIAWAAIRSAIRAAVARRAAPTSSTDSLAPVLFLQAVEVPARPGMAPVPELPAVRGPVGAVPP
jgi:hypothetical protein